MERKRKNIDFCFSPQIKLINFLILSEGKHYCDTKFKINSLLKAAEMYFMVFLTVYVASSRVLSDSMVEHECAFFF